MKYLDVLAVLLAGLASFVTSKHHMKRSIPLTPRQNNGNSNNTPLMVSNYCGETIYPGILTQGGSGPQSTGFELSPGANMSQMVSENWQGRVWGRTNCSFGGSKGGGQACGTGDCAGQEACTVTVRDAEKAHKLEYLLTLYRVTLLSHLPNSR